MVINSSVMSPGTPPRRPKYKTEIVIAQETASTILVSGIRTTLGFAKYKECHTHYRYVHITQQR